MWGEKGDVDLLGCSSVVGTNTELQATATVKNKKGLKITRSRRDIGQFFTSDCIATQIHSKELVLERQQV